MKIIATLLFLAAAAVGFAQSAPANPPPPVNVRLDTEVEQLARGYAAAFSAITHTPIYLIHTRDDTTTVLVSLRSVRAVDGVLVVQDEKNLTYVINPRDVVMITDAPPKKDN
ncbi:MAG TPA: hypothetical protein VMD31_04565 [Opitutaceae bacterium]|nr:hypothetical protein [Opitutaceae bacterium]